MGFKMEGLDELLEKLEELSESPMKLFEGDIINLVCPVCEIETDIQIIQNNKAKCLKCNSEIELNIVSE